MQHNAQQKCENPEIKHDKHTIHNTKIVWKNVSSGFRTPSLHFLIQPVACILGGIRQCCRVCLLLEGNRVNCQPGIFQIKFMKCNQSGGSSHKLWMRLLLRYKTKTFGATRRSMCNSFFFHRRHHVPVFFKQFLILIWFKNHLQPLARNCLQSLAFLSFFWSKLFFWTIFFWIKVFFEAKSSL